MLKLPYVLYGIGLISSLTSVVATLISAPAYESIFVFIAVCCLISIGTLAYAVNKLSTPWRIATIVPAFLVAYSASDAFFRAFFGTLMIDFLSN